MAELDPVATPQSAVRGSVWCIVVAGGTGARFGAPKQFEELDGRRIVERSLDAARSTADGVVLVVPPDRVAEESERGRGVTVCAGGATRSASVRAGLAAVPPGAEVVVVHDAARPLAPQSLFERVITAVRSGADGAIPAVPVSDTIKETSGDPAGGLLGAPVGRTLDRSRLLAVQTPQAFRAEVLRAAHRGEPEATDDAALVEAAGGTVVFAPGEVTNVKITHRHDLVMAAAILATDAERPSAPR